MPGCAHLPSLVHVLCCQKISLLVLKGTYSRFQNILKSIWYRQCWTTMGFLAFLLGESLFFFFLLTWPKFLNDSNTFHSSAYTWISSMPLVNPDWYSIYYRNACSTLMYHYVNELMLLHNILHYSPYVTFTRLGHGLNFSFYCALCHLSQTVSLIY